MNARHLIEQFDVAIAFGSSGARLRDDDELVALVEDVLLPVVDAALEAWDEPGSVLSVPELALDLGTIARADLHHQAPLRLRALLDDALAAARQQARSLDAAREQGATRRSTAEDDMARLAGFLDSGRMAWHMDVVQADLHVALLDRVLARGDGLRAVLGQVLERPWALRRLVEQFPERQLAALVKGLAGTGAAELLAQCAQSQAREQAAGKSGFEAQSAAWQAVLAAALGLRAPAIPHTLARAGDAPALDDVACFAAFIRTGRMTRANGADAHVVLFDLILGASGDRIKRALWLVLAKALGDPACARRLVTQFPQRQLREIVRRAAPVRGAALQEQLYEADTTAMSDERRVALWTPLLRSAVRDHVAFELVPPRREPAAAPHMPDEVMDIGQDEENGDDLARFALFIRTGRLTLAPGAGPARGRADAHVALLDALLAGREERRRRLWHVLLDALRDPQSTRRLLEQFPERQLHDIVRSAAPLSSDALIALAALMVEEGSRLGVEPQRLRRAVWSPILSAAVRSGAGRNDVPDLELLRDRIRASFATDPGEHELHASILACGGRMTGALLDIARTLELIARGHPGYPLAAGRVAVLGAALAGAGEDEINRLRERLFGTGLSISWRTARTNGAIALQKYAAEPDAGIILLAEQLRQAAASRDDDVLRRLVLDGSDSDLRALLQACAGNATDALLEIADAMMLPARGHGGHTLTSGWVDLLFAAVNVPTAESLARLRMKYLGMPVSVGGRAQDKASRSSGASLRHEVSRGSRIAFGAAGHVSRGQQRPKRWAIDGRSLSASLPGQSNGKGTDRRTTTSTPDESRTLVPGHDNNALHRLVLSCTARELRTLLQSCAGDAADALLEIADAMILAARGHAGYPLASGWVDLLSAALDVPSAESLARLRTKYLGMPVPVNGRTQDKASRLSGAGLRRKVSHGSSIAFSGPGLANRGNQRLKRSGIEVRSLSESSPGPSRGSDNDRPATTSAPDESRMAVPWHDNNVLHRLVLSCTKRDLRALLKSCAGDAADSLLEIADAVTLAARGHVGYPLVSAWVALLSAAVGAPASDESRRLRARYLGAPVPVLRKRAIALSPRNLATSAGASRPASRPDSGLPTSINRAAGAKALSTSSNGQSSKSPTDTRTKTPASDEVLTVATWHDNETLRQLVVSCSEDDLRNLLRSCTGTAADAMLKIADAMLLAARGHAGYPLASAWVELLCAALRKPSDDVLRELRDRYCGVQLSMRVRLDDETGRRSPPDTSGEPASQGTSTNNIDRASADVTRLRAVLQGRREAGFEGNQLRRLLAQDTQAVIGVVHDELRRNSPAQRAVVVHRLAQACTHADMRALVQTCAGTASEELLAMVDTIALGARGRAAYPRAASWAELLDAALSGNPAKDELARLRTRFVGATALPDVRPVQRAAIVMPPAWQNDPGHRHATRAVERLLAVANAVRSPESSSRAGHRTIIAASGKTQSVSATRVASWCSALASALEQPQAHGATPPSAWSALLAARKTESENMIKLLAARRPWRTMLADGLPEPMLFDLVALSHGAIAVAMRSLLAHGPAFAKHLGAQWRSRLWQAALVVAAGTVQLPSNEAEAVCLHLLRTAAGDNAQSQAALLTAWLGARHAKATRPVEPAPAIRRQHQPQEKKGPGVEQGERIALANAGMVLAAPYLPRLFGMLGLTDGGAFVDSAAAERAVLLLQLLVSGEAGAAEYQLPLNKLLCGLALDAPVPATFAPTQAERDTVDGLLQAMIATWNALGRTSVAGLRESFLMRGGELELQADAWRLKVEEGPFDMLMDRLPWGFSIVKFPWMPLPLHVDWH